MIACKHVNTSGRRGDGLSGVCIYRNGEWLPHLLLLLLGWAEMRRRLSALSTEDEKAGAERKASEMRKRLDVLCTKDKKAGEQHGTCGSYPDHMSWISPISTPGPRALGPCFDASHYGEYDFGGYLGELKHKKAVFLVSISADVWSKSERIG